MAILKGCIFDIDGTLADSMGIWGDIDRAFLEKRSIVMPDDYIDAVSSMSFEEAARYTIGRFSLPDEPRSLMAEWDDMSRRAYGTMVRLFPGAEEYLRNLRGNGVRLAVATDLEREIAISSLRSNGILELFDAVATTREAGRDKRSADVFLLASSRLSLPPSSCMVYEDLESAAGVASHAGFMTMMASRFHEDCLSLVR